MEPIYQGTRTLFTCQCAVDMIAYCYEKVKNNSSILPLDEKDREAITAIREYYGLHSDADAIRVAIRELERAIRRRGKVVKIDTLGDV